MWQYSVQIISKRVKACQYEALIYVAKDRDVSY